MLTNNRNELRQHYLSAWHKACANEPLSALEEQIVAVIRQHPEYQPLLEQGETALAREWRPESGDTNPFLHMGLHLALQEQLATDRPAGIRRLYKAMIDACLGDVHTAEHRILDCLAEALWKAQRDGQDLRPKAYLKCIKRRGAGQKRGV